jgi:hypothetical protein
VQATKRGAHDFIEKPLTGDKLLITVKNALELARLTRENARYKARAAAEHSMIGKSSSMRVIADKIAKTAPSSGRVLITGENGTGKELVARAIHDQSRRAKGPFVKLNCAAIPSELIESELFGHEKGAFTGATKDRRGKFEQADGGTLVPRRDRRHEPERPGQGPAGVARGRARAGRRQRDDQGRRPGDRRDQQGPASRDRGRAVPRGPVLPAGGGADRDAAAARPQGRRAGADRALPGA